MKDLFDANIRFDHLIWIPGAIAAGDAFGENFEEFCEYIAGLEEGDSPQILDKLPEFGSWFADAYYDDRNGAMEELARLMFVRKRVGFVAQIATPVVTYLTPDMGSCSWGHYATTWLYEESIDDLAAAAVRWADEKRAHWRAKLAPPATFDATSGPASPPPDTGG